jgi:GT2 family glycosyltransferase
LEGQTYPDDQYEVIVVDNASEEDIDSVVTSFACARTVTEEQRGSYAARNRGIQEAQGEIIAFTDADCMPSATWIEEGVKCLVEKECGVVGGRIEFSFQTPNRPNPVELFDSSHYLDQKKYVRHEHFAATANAFTWRRLFDKVGPFNEALRSGGDTEWGRRVWRQGYKICYADAARVEHPARHTYKALREKKLRILEGTMQLRREKKYPVSEVVKHSVTDVGHHAKFALKVALSGSYSTTNVLVAVLSFLYQGFYTALKRLYLRGGKKP